MRLHLLAIPHTVTRSDFSHCAFTGKVQRFSPMLRAEGFYVLHYGVEGAASNASEDVELMSTEEHLQYLGLKDYHENPSKFYGDSANASNEVYRQFNYSARQELKERLEPGDVICLPFGLAHNEAWQGLPLVESDQVKLIETGIGYSEPFHLNRVYESHAWRHWVMGKENRGGTDWSSRRKEWVVPNYYDTDEWVLGNGRTNRVVYFGRLDAVKGCDIIPQLAKSRPDLEFVICGQGDPTPYLTSQNVVYQPPVAGEARGALLRTAMVSLHPSRFVEPFCGAAVEAMLSGTPVLTSDFGAFTETVVPGITGIRCRTFKDWLRGLDLARAFNRREVRDTAVSRYSMRVVGRQYATVFDELCHD